MPMPMPIPMPRCRSRDFQMAVLNQDIVILFSFTKTLEAAARGVYKKVIIKNFAILAGKKASLQSLFTKVTGL